MYSWVQGWEWCRRYGKKIEGEAWREWRGVCTKTEEQLQEVLLGEVHINLMLYQSRDAEELAKRKKVPRMTLKSLAYRISIEVQMVGIGITLEIIWGTLAKASVQDTA